MGVVVGRRNGCVVEVVGEADERFGYAVVVVVQTVGGGFDRAELHAYAPANENIKRVLHLCEPRSLPVDVLPLRFDTLDCSLPSQDGLLFLPKPLNFLLDPS
jgi:hypothetical protein